MRMPGGSLSGHSSLRVRISTLAWAGTANLLGAAGDSWMRFLGGDARAAWCAVGAIALWIAAPLGLGSHLIARRDL